MIIPSPNVSHLGNAFSDHSNHGDTTHISRANQHSLHYALSAKNGGGEPQRQGLGNRKRQGPAADFGAASWLPICAIDSPEAHPSQNSKNHQNIPVVHNQNGVRNPGACFCRSWVFHHAQPLDYWFLKDDGHSLRPKTVFGKLTNPITTSWTPAGSLPRPSISATRVIAAERGLSARRRAASQPRTCSFPAGFPTARRPAGGQLVPKSCRR